MANAITAIQHYTRGSSTCIQTQYGLLLEKDFWCIKFIEEDFGCLNSILIRVEGRFSKQDWMLLWGDLQLLKDMSPE